MSFDLIQWHHPFWGMFQVQLVVYAICAMALAAASKIKTGKLVMFFDAVKKSHGLLTASLAVTVIANLISAFVFNMKTPLPIVAFESIGVLWLSVTGLFAFFGPFLSGQQSISNMKPLSENC